MTLKTLPPGDPRPKDQSNLGFAGAPAKIRLPELQDESLHLHQARETTRPNPLWHARAAFPISRSAFHLC